MGWNEANYILDSANVGTGRNTRHPSSIPNVQWWTLNRSEIPYLDSMRWKVFVQRDQVRFGLF